jgi:hypothetical protein
MMGAFSPCPGHLNFRRTMQYGIICKMYEIMIFLRIQKVGFHLRKAALCAIAVQ